MCRWHKLAAKDAATNSETGEFDAAKYAVALTAMGLFRVEQDRWGLKDLFEIDGFNPEEILTDGALAAYKKTPMAGRDMAEVKASLAQNVEILRKALDQLAAENDVCTVDGLNIPKGVTEEGYKATCCAPANPRDNGPFLDAAVVYLAKGYDDAERSYARGALELISAEELTALVHDETVAENDRPYIGSLENLRALSAKFLAMPNVEAAMEGAFRDSVSYIFDTAAYDLENGLGLTGASDCIMCEGAKGRKSAEAEDAIDTPKEQGVLSRMFNPISKRFPQKLKNAFKACASCSGNIIIPHLPCISLMAMASSSALAAAYVSNIWLVGATSIAAAVGGYTSWRRSRFEKASKLEHGVMIAGPVLAAGLMIGMHLPGSGMHDHHHMQPNNDNHQHHEHYHHMQTADPEGWDAAQTWFKTLEGAEAEKVRNNAAAWNMPLEEAVYHSHMMCSSPTVKLKTVRL
ncbi:MAG: hypothetical protein CL561_09840 [Alphaproteobacteria bacterium]|nr:hypothetical protein [Alphaproteobacteria bacterium]|tara:strand:+ start:796 stop:2181 length:1386 start_codon:yes stop_codon:yes gene_type:complete